MESTQVDTAVVSQLTDADGRTQQYITQPIGIEYKTPQKSLEDALNFNEQALILPETRLSPSSNGLTRRQNANNNTIATAATVGTGASVANTNITDNSTSKMRDFVNTMMRKMNDTKYLYPSMAVLIMAIIVIIILFQKISVLVKIICVILLIIFMAATVVQFKQF